MDKELQEKVIEAVSAAGKILAENIDYQSLDPVVRLMLAAVMNEERKIEDSVAVMPEKIVDRFCEEFIPWDKVCAMPSIALLKMLFRPQSVSDALVIDGESSFTFKQNTPKCQLNFLPLFRTLAVPYEHIYILSHNVLSRDGVRDDVHIEMSGQTNIVWVGLETGTEVDSLRGLAFLLRNTDFLEPEHIFIGPCGYELDYSGLSDMDELPMNHPFDARQASGAFLSMIENWKDSLMTLGNERLFYITTDVVERDIFKTETYPAVFRNWLESETLNRFRPGTLWMKIVFPENYAVPDTFSVEFNVLPVVNVDVNSLMLTGSTPIARLQKKEDSFFLQILETSNEDYQNGFGDVSDDVLIRDFDASAYNDEELYRDVRMLYNHFVDDYFAFMEYNGVRDGNLISSLRESVNRIAKDMESKNTGNRFDSGVYAMLNLGKRPLPSAVRVSYLTTQGKMGNAPAAGSFMENRKYSLLLPKLPVIVPASGGSDRASQDERYELMRYYALTNDRLYTRKDIEAFLRKEIMSEFSGKEFGRINIRMSIEGAAGDRGLRRGLYIDIEFKDRKNWIHARNTLWDRKILMKINAGSCLSMPVIVNLVDKDIPE